MKVHTVEIVQSSEIIKSKNGANCHWLNPLLKPIHDDSGSRQPRMIGRILLPQVSLDVPGTAEMRAVIDALASWIAPNHSDPAALERDGANLDITEMTIPEGLAKTYTVTAIDGHEILETIIAFRRA